jgi:hypothetical protein
MDTAGPSDEYHHTHELERLGSRPHFIRRYRQMSKKLSREDHNPLNDEDWPSLVSSPHGGRFSG